MDNRHSKTTVGRGTIIESPTGVRYRVLGSSKDTVTLRRINNSGYAAFDTRTSNVERYGYRVVEQGADERAPKAVQADDAKDDHKGQLDLDLGF